MLRLRLAVPLHLYLNASDPNLLKPSLIFHHESSTVLVSLKGAPPLRVTGIDAEEPDFSTIFCCRIEIRNEHKSDDLLSWVETHNHHELVGFVMPIVNKTLRAIRNFGWVTTAREYKPEPKPERLLRAWNASARIRGKWKEVAPESKREPFDVLYGLQLDENVERGSLSVRRWKDIEQALVESLSPNPEDEFLTNALQHLRDENLRLALIEATVCLEIVLSRCIIAYLEVKRHFTKKKIESVLSNVGLTSKVGLILDLIFTAEERRRAQLDSVLRAIGWRNKIIHRTGHIPYDVSGKEVHDCVYATLNLALKLGERLERLRVEPETVAIARQVAIKFNSPLPTIEVLKYHKVKVSFSYLSEAAMHFRPRGVPAIPPPPTPNEDGLRQIVTDLELRLKARDDRFEPSKHLSVVFERNLGQVFASFQNGEWSVTAADVK